MKSGAPTGARSDVCAEEALKASHEDGRREHDEAVTRLRKEYDRLQNRIDAMYLDKLDGVVDSARFERMAGEWREDQESLMRSMEAHQDANEVYIDEGVRLLELAQKAHSSSSYSRTARGSVGNSPQHSNNPLI